MPAPVMTPARVAAAKILQAQGWSLRRIAEVFDCDHQCVHRALNPQAKAKWEAYMSRYHKALNPTRNKRTYELRMAREQAAQENVKVEVICERWKIEPPRGVASSSGPRRSVRSVEPRAG